MKRRFVTPNVLLIRANLPLAESGADGDVLSIACCRMAMETRLRRHVAPHIDGRPDSIALSELGAILAAKGLLSRVDRNAVSRLAKLAGRTIHTASATPNEAKRAVDVSADIITRLDDR